MDNKDVEELNMTNLKSDNSLQENENEIETSLLNPEPSSEIINGTDTNEESGNLVATIPSNQVELSDGAITKTEVQTISTSIYIEKLKLLVKLGTGIADQSYDFYTIGILIWGGHNGFAVLFLFADLCPAISIMWERFKLEKSLKIFRFWFQPVNLLVWNLMALFNGKYLNTFLMIKSVHSALEAPSQIILTITMMSMGILELPGSEDRSFINAYNISIDLRWWPIFSTGLSFISILFGTWRTFHPVRKETSKYIALVLFFPVYILRMVVWLIITITLERFVFFIVGLMVATNTLILFLYQRKELMYDPLNCGCLSVVIPTWSVTALNKSDYSDNISNRSLSVLFGLVVGGNTLLVVAYFVVYVLYSIGIYNPWCIQNLNHLLFEEELFEKSVWIIAGLYLAATLPIVILYSTKNVSLSPTYDGFLKHLVTHKSLFVGGISVALLEISLGCVLNGLSNFNQAPKINSTIISRDNIENLGWSSWSEWSDNERSRERLCRNYHLRQIDVKETEDDLKYLNFVRNFIQAKPIGSTTANTTGSISTSSSSTTTASTSTILPDTFITETSDTSPTATDTSSTAPDTSSTVPDTSTPTSFTVSTHSESPYVHPVTTVTTVVTNEIYTLSSISVTLSPDIAAGCHCAIYIQLTNPLTGQRCITNELDRPGDDWVYGSTALWDGDYLGSCLSLKTTKDNPSIEIDFLLSGLNHIEVDAVLTSFRSSQSGDLQYQQFCLGWTSVDQKRADPPAKFPSLLYDKLNQEITDIVVSDAQMDFEQANEFCKNLKMIEIQKSCDDLKVQAFLKLTQPFEDATFWIDQKSEKSFSKLLNLPKGSGSKSCVRTTDQSTRKRITNCSFRSEALAVCLTSSYKTFNKALIKY